MAARSMRGKIAFLIAPVPIVVLFGVIAKTRGAKAGDAITGVVVCIVGAWLLQLMPGIVIAGWLKLYKVELWRCVVGGALLYPLPALIAAGLDAARSLPMPSNYITTLGYFVMAGAAAGFTGWLVMRTHDQRVIDLDALRDRFE